MRKDTHLREKRKSQNWKVKKETNSKEKKLNGFQREKNGTDLRGKKLSKSGNTKSHRKYPRQQKATARNCRRMALYLHDQNDNGNYESQRKPKSIDTAFFWSRHRFCRLFFRCCASIPTLKALTSLLFGKRVKDGIHPSGCVEASENSGDNKIKDARRFFCCSRWQYTDRFMMTMRTTR